MPKEKSITVYSNQKQMKYAKPANMQLTPAEETPVQSELLSAQCWITSRQNLLGNIRLPKTIWKYNEFLRTTLQKYNIQITPQTVLTHYEFGKQNPKTTSAGKIDINYLPPYQWITKEEVGSFIRTKIKWYLNKINKIN